MLDVVAGVELPNPLPVLPPNVLLPPNAEVLLNPPKDVVESVPKELTEEPAKLLEEPNTPAGVLVPPKELALAENKASVDVCPFPAPNAEFSVDVEPKGVLEAPAPNAPVDWPNAGVVLPNPGVVVVDWVTPKPLEPPNAEEPLPNAGAVFPDVILLNPPENNPD